MAIFDHQGDRLHYLVEGRGVPVLLLHSLGGSKAMWRTTFDALSRDYTVVAFDARGHGDTIAKRPFTIAGYAEDALALADHLGYSQFHLVGISMGGRAALHFALHWPERLKSMVLADASFSGTSGGPARIAGVKKRIAEIGPAAFAEEYTRSRLMPATSETVLRRYVEDVVRTVPDVYVTTLEAILAVDLGGKLGGIATPSLVVVGENDVAAPPAVAQDLASQLPNAELAIIPNANHFANLDQPDRFNQVLKQFLDRQ